MESCCSVNHSCCCSSPAKAVKTTTTLTLQDNLGSWKARWGINRMNYKVDPGLYYIGQPDTYSPVLVTANYKMSFDSLRKELTGISAWILVLDTKGVNVWCAAGKGTFGTEELIHRIDNTGLSKVVDHNTVILPQLGAVGVSALEVKKRSGFKVIYGPVRAKDVPAFLQNGMKADREMRSVTFGFVDRSVLIPVELVGAIKPTLILFGVMFLLNAVGLTAFSSADLYSYIIAVFVGCAIVPMLLPWIPGRAFSLKGWIMGMIWATSTIYINDFFQTMNYGFLACIAYLLILPSVSAYYALQFTGCSTYTSLSGVMKEMKRAIPIIAASTGVGIILLLAAHLLSVL